VQTPSVPKGTLHELIITEEVAGDHDAEKNRMSIKRRKEVETNYFRGATLNRSSLSAAALVRRPPRFRREATLGQCFAEIAPSLALPTRTDTAQILRVPATVAANDHGRTEDLRVPALDRPANLAPTGVDPLRRRNT
jgi:hypothetical protein